ncbi:hypothetical protein HZH68_002101 [Vespula germanica]|uniref:Uncharacterized protein n=1 Tax=Vespula germanica TaxID=30212 RepID=A0A834NL78_VESGE|nr:hypothetical protein HZH68_002101 [Vespula germanica]
MPRVGKRLERTNPASDSQPFIDRIDVSKTQQGVGSLEERKREEEEEEEKGGEGEGEGEGEGGGGGGGR